MGCCRGLAPNKQHFYRLANDTTAAICSFYVVCQFEFVQQMQCCSKHCHFTIVLHADQKDLHFLGMKNFVYTEPALILMVANVDSFLKLASSLYLVLVKTSVGIQIISFSRGDKVFKLSSSFKFL